MNTIKNKKIAIVGGGPGGLTLARLLQINGADVKVYERDLNRNARVQGATLDLHDESGLKALRAAGLMDAFKANYRPGADRLRITDKNARLLLDEHVNAKNEMSRPEIDRGPLKDILLDSLQPDTVVWNSQFLALTNDRDTSAQKTSWKLEFQNGSAAFADIVIGADGANSKIRPYITPIKPFYVGVTAIEGAVYNAERASPKVNELLQGGKIFAMGDEKTLIVGSKGDGSLAFYIGFKTAEDWYRTCGINFSDNEQVLSWFRKEFAGWNPLWQELFENAEPHFIPRPQYCMPLDQSWDALPNLTLLGDAAHLMPPYAGEGVNMAMLDALELAQCLTRGDHSAHSNHSNPSHHSSQSSQSDHSNPSNYSNPSHHSGQSKHFEHSNESDQSDHPEHAGHSDLQTAIAAYEKQMRARASETAGDTLVSTAALHSPNAIRFLMETIGA